MAGARSMLPDACFGARDRRPAPVRADPAEAASDLTIATAGMRCHGRDVPPQREPSHRLVSNLGTRREHAGRPHGAGYPGHASRCSNTRRGMTPCMRVGAQLRDALEQRRRRSSSNIPEQVCRGSVALTTLQLRRHRSRHAGASERRVAAGSRPGVDGHPPGLGDAA